MFSVDSKTFEILIEEVKGKVLGEICEKGLRLVALLRMGNPLERFGWKRVDIIC